MQHGGWMAEPRRGAHLNEDAPAQPHADVRTSQPVATSGSDHAIAVGRRARNERERARKQQGRNSHASPDGTTLDLSFLSWHCRSSRGAAAAGAAIWGGGGSHHNRRRYHLSQLVSALGPTGSGRQDTQSLNSRLVIER